jgi:hypothetical protein
MGGTSGGTGFNAHVLTRTLLPLAALAAIATPVLGAVTVVPPPSAAPGAVQPLVPGLSYTVMNRPGPQVLHVLTMRPNALLSLGPTQLSGSLSQRATLTSGMTARLATGATAGSNADYFDLGTGTPSGILSVGPRLWAGPEPSRSALTIANGGALAVGKLTLAGRYQKLDPAGTTPFPKRTFRGVNRPLPSTSSTGVVIYTPDFGRPTPSTPGYEAVVAIDGGVPLSVNAPLQGTVIAQGTGGGTAIGTGQVVIYGKNASGTSIINELTVGSRVELEAGIAGIAPDAWGAVGGGPMIVQGGVAVPSAGEGFTASQLTGRTTRTAVGQTADGRILMVVSEGPQQGKRGYTTAEQGTLMVSLGATDAIGFDSGGSSLMALGRQQVIPWSSERAIADGLIATYLGAQISIPSPQRVSPNADGLADSSSIDAQSPVAGHTLVTIARRGGGGFSSVLLDQTGAPASNQIAIDPATLAMPEGPYVVTTTLTPADGTPATTMNRNLVVDGTLGSLKVSAKTTGKGKAKTNTVKTSFTLSRQAKVTMKIVNSSGKTVAKGASNRKMSGGNRTVTWSGKALPAGSYNVVVTAQSSYGLSGLQDSIRLR